jgi:hypothetical protein
MWDHAKDFSEMERDGGAENGLMYDEY